ncbi:MAG: hypothetical protein IJS93_01480, partial [Clostridia bacterium]|nr:hypothetical protein [Clostridia bacterium]
YQGRALPTEPHQQGLFFNVFEHFLGCALNRRFIFTKDVLYRLSHISIPLMLFDYRTFLKICQTFF